MKRQSDIVRKQYSQIIQTDPSSIGIPPSGEVYAGMYNDLKWYKYPDGSVEYQSVKVKTLTISNASGAETVSIPGGYMIQTITAYQTAATPTVKAGRTLGGQDIVYPTEIASGEVITTTVNQEMQKSSDATLYVTVAGIGAMADIYITVIKIR